MTVFLFSSSPKQEIYCPVLLLILWKCPRYKSPPLTVNALESRSDLLLEKFMVHISNANKTVYPDYKCGLQDGNSAIKLDEKYVIYTWE